MHLGSVWYSFLFSVRDSARFKIEQKFSQQRNKWLQCPSIIKSDSIERERKREYGVAAKLQWRALENIKPSANRGQERNNE